MRLIALLFVACIWSTGRATTEELRCEYADIHPAYPAVNAPPVIQAADSGDNMPRPVGASCFPPQKDSATWVTVAAVLQTQLNPADILGRFGAISQLHNIQYWSTTDNAWRPLVSAAFAVNTPRTSEPRADYSAADLAAQPRYYKVTDTRTYSPITYRLETYPAPTSHLLLETTNLDPVKKWGITLYPPDGVRTLYMLEERTPGIWSYYSITRVIPATFLAKGHASSYINRAAALYRHYMHLPTAAEPPPAR